VKWGQDFTFILPGEAIRPSGSPVIYTCGRKARSMLLLPQFPRNTGLRQVSGSALVVALTADCGIARPTG